MSEDKPENREAEALFQMVSDRYGDRLDAEQLEEVKKGVEAIAEASQALRDEQGRSNTSILGLSVALDRRNNRLDPSGAADIYTPEQVQPTEWVKIEGEPNSFTIYNQLLLHRPTLPHHLVHHLHRPSICTGKRQ